MGALEDNDMDGQKSLKYLAAVLDSGRIRIDEVERRGGRQVAQVPTGTTFPHTAKGRRAAWDHLAEQNARLAIA
jgi:hypothetical protein